jgi:hypothetical protein
MGWPLHYPASPSARSTFPSERPAEPISPAWMNDRRDSRRVRANSAQPLEVGRSDIGKPAAGSTRKRANFGDRTLTAWGSQWQVGRGG